MTTKEARLELQRANACVRQAVENALEMKAAASEIPSSLERIAKAIESIAAEPIEGDVNALKPELEVLRSRMRQLQVLLDSAAVFYCVSIRHGRTIANGTYSADGTQTAGVTVHQMQIRL